MNYLPTRYCFDCQRIKPRDGFRSMGRKPNTRIVCADCAQKIERERAKACKS